MQATRVQFSTEVAEYLANLAFVLLINEYFSFLENAENFVLKLYDTIENQIHTLKHHSTTDENKSFGTHYIVIKMHKGFAYHAYFVFKDNVYYVTKISSNELPDAEFLNQ